MKKNCTSSWLFTTSTDSILRLLDRYNVTLLISHTPLHFLGVLNCWLQFADVIAILSVRFTDMW